MSVGRRLLLPLLLLLLKKVYRVSSSVCVECLQLLTICIGLLSGRSKELHYLNRAIESEDGGGEFSQTRAGGCLDTTIVKVLIINNIQ